MKEAEGEGREENEPKIPTLDPGTARSPQAFSLAGCSSSGDNFRPTESRNLTEDMITSVIGPGAAATLTTVRSPDSGIPFPSRLVLGGVGIDFVVDTTTEFAGDGGARLVGAAGDPTAAAADIIVAGAITSGRGCGRSYRRSCRRSCERASKSGGGATDGTISGGGSRRDPTGGGKIL